MPDSGDRNLAAPQPGIRPVSIADEMRSSYLDYAMSVIVSRALPDVRDGLQPVHRRILYSMYESNYTPERPYSKSARVTGDTMGKYHPHGNLAIYDALVRMAQPFSMRLPLITARGISARSTAIRRQLSDTRKCALPRRRCRCLTISTTRRSISSPITTGASASPPSCPRSIQTCL